MPRFRISRPAASDAIAEDDSNDFDDLHDQFDEPTTGRRRGRPSRPADAPRLVIEGKSGRTLVDSDGADDSSDDSAAGDVPDDARSAAPYSSYDVATHGPRPVPDWLVTSLSARDTRLGVIKTGKEADVGLLDRSLPGGPGCLLAVKTFRGAAVPSGSPMNSIISSDPITCTG